MRIFLRIIGWILLVIGGLGTAGNVASIASGIPGRSGFLAFGLVLVVVGLALARPSKKRAAAQPTLPNDNNG